MSAATFIVDCHVCKAKVGAVEKGRAERSYFDEDAGEPFGERVLVGECPRCKSLLVGKSEKIHFADFDAEYDEWSDVVRVFPKPSKTFSSFRIPRTAKASLDEADRSLQASANIAACVMFGRALEAVCRDILIPKGEQGKGKHVMLGAGIKQLREKNIIDDRLYDWSQQLNAFRNLAAHPEDISISREDTGDLQAFVYAIVEYIYDLTDRYEEFKARAEEKKQKKKSPLHI